MTDTRGWSRAGLPFLLLRVLGQGTEFAGFVALARGLPPDAFGRLSIAFLIARYFGLVADWGASVQGARAVARGDDPAAVEALMRHRGRVSALLSLVFTVAVVPIAGASFAFLAIVISARGLNRDWISLGTERGASSGAASIAQGTALLGSALLLSTAEQGAAAIGGAYGIGLAVSLALHRRPARADAKEGTASAPRVDGWILGAVLADQVTISADTLLLGALRDSASAGVYSAVYRVPNAWMTLIGLTVLGLVPRTARLVSASSLTNARAILRRSLRVGVLGAILVLVSTGPALVAVPAVFGQQYSSGRQPLLVLLVATAIMAVSASLHPLYFAVARDRDIFTLSLGGAVVNLTVNVLAIPRWGMVGAAMATLAAQAALLVTLSLRLRRTIA